MEDRLARFEDKVNTLIKRNDRKDVEDDAYKIEAKVSNRAILSALEELKSKNNARDIAEAEERGRQEIRDEQKKRSRTRLAWIIAFTLPATLTFFTWIVMSIHEIQLFDAKRATPKEDKAIHKPVKPVKKVEDEEA